MRVILKLSSNTPELEPWPVFSASQDPGYRMRPRSLVLSGFLHCALVAVLYWGSDFTTTPSRPIYEKIIEPNKAKLIWYKLKSDLPDLNSPNTRKTETQGTIKSRHVLITDSRQGSKSEFVWQPSPAELPKEVKAPNLISIQASAPALPTPTPPALPAPEQAKRLFIPPPPAAKPIAQATPAAPVTLPAPAIRMQTAPVKLPVAPLLEARLPAAPASEPAVAGPEQPKRQFTPPPARAKPAGGSASGDLSAPAPPSPQPIGNLNIASINLNSIAVPAALPPGRRAGQFSSAPKTGDLPGSNESGGASVPGLSARGTGSSGTRVPVLEPPAVAASLPFKSTIAYRDVMSHAIGSSLSVPLRPGSRTIPDRVEQKFHDKPVYTMVLPSPKLPEYAADWILWFSERTIPAAGVAPIRAPIPEKKHIPESQVAYIWGKEADVLIAAVIDENGHIQNASIVKFPPGFPPELALADLNTWQFKPATRNGVPIAVEALLDIPFRHIASGPKP